MGWRLAVLAVWVVVSAAARAQVPAGASVVLRQMASHASVVFAGQVTEVERNDAAGFVDVRFRIAQALRGCPKSGTYVLREWAGLWAGRPERFRVGQRRLMLLTARGAAGMSSPVGGTDGAIPLIATGAEPLADAAGIAPPESGVAATDYAVDLRWIAARAVRAVVPANGAQSQAILAHGGPILAREADWSGAIAPLAAPALTAKPVSLAAVFALLSVQGGAR